VEEIGEDLKELFRHRNTIDAEIQRRLPRFEKGEGYTADGCLSAKAWLRWNCHLTFSAASERVEVARQLESLELTSRALAEGEISYQHAAMIARAAERLGERFEGPAEEILVELARKEDPVCSGGRSSTFATASNPMGCSTTPTTRTSGAFST